MEETTENGNEMAEKTDNLRREAEELRARLRDRRGEFGRPEFSGWSKAFYALVILGIIASSFLLLWFADLRRNAVGVVATVILESAPSADRVFDLPPPPPRTEAPRVQASGPGFIFTDSGFEGVLYSSPSTTPGSAARAATDAEFVPPPVTGESERAFELLKARAEVVGDLIEGRREDLTYQEWSPLKDDPPVVWIDLTATRAEDGAVVHLVWEVNLGNESIRPMSQAARDLVR
jgi:hypothetical protein